jgi:hypothetical protein
VLTEKVSEMNLPDVLHPTKRILFQHLAGIFTVKKHINTCQESFRDSEFAVIMAV